MIQVHKILEYHYYKKPAKDKAVKEAEEETEKAEEEADPGSLT